MAPGTGCLNALTDNGVFAGWCVSARLGDSETNLSKLAIATEQEHRA